MAERSQPPQDRRHQPPHQRAITVGKRFQSRMGGGSVQLVVKGSALVEDAVEDVGRNPTRRQAGHFGRSYEP